MPSSPTRPAAVIPVGDGWALERSGDEFSHGTDPTQGILPLTNGQFRQNVRLNVDQGLSEAERKTEVLVSERRRY